MRKLFSVAEHIFAIEATADQFSLLGDYAPFEVADGEPLFVLHIADGTLRKTDDYTHVFVDSSDDDMPRIEVYAAADRWRFDVSKWKTSPVCFSLFANVRFANATLYIKDADVRFAIDNAAMLLYAFATAGSQTLEMHASVIVKDGYGQLFLGHSGTGKSTHACGGMLIPMRGCSMTTTRWCGLCPTGKCAFTVYRGAGIPLATGRLLRPYAG